MQLIHAGKVLKEDGVVVSSLLQYQGPLVLHVVIRAPSPAPSPSPPSSSQPLENAASANGTASQSQQTERADLSGSREASTSQPSAQNASFDAGPNVNGRWATNGSPALQQAVYQAAYEAALQVIRQSASTQSGWIPSAIPIPQPVLPAGVFHMHPPVGTTTGTIDGQGHGNVHGNAGQGPPPPLLMPVLPLPVPAGQQVAIQPVQFGYGFGYGAQDADNVMRQRRPPPPAGPPHRVDVLGNAFGVGARGGQARHVVDQPRNRPRQFQLRFQINIRALLQFLVFAIIVYQHCPPRRFAVLVVLGAALWLSTMAPVRAFLRQLAGFRPPVAQPIPPAAAGREGLQQGLAFEGQRPIQDQAGLNPAPLEVRVQNGAPHNRVLGVLRGIQTFVAGFITSLLPAVEPNAGGEGDGRQRGAVAQDVFGGQ